MSTKTWTSPINYQGKKWVVEVLTTQDGTTLTAHNIDDQDEATLSLTGPALIAVILEQTCLAGDCHHPQS
jgi:hypothetical protein